MFQYIIQSFRIFAFPVWRQKLSIRYVWKVFELSHPSQAYHQSSPFKILFLLVLGWVLACGHPHDDHGIVKQGMFKVYPRSSSRQLSNFHLFQQFLLQWSLEPGLNFESESDVCFSLCGAKKRWRLGRRQDCCQEPLDQETWPRNSWLWTFHEKSFNPHGESQRVDILTENPIFMSYWKYPNNILKENPKAYFYEKLL